MTRACRESEAHSQHIVMRRLQHLRRLSAATAQLDARPGGRLSRWIDSEGTHINAQDSEICISNR
jgi:hypothetical protein